MAEADTIRASGIVDDFWRLVRGELAFDETSNAIVAKLFDISQFKPRPVETALENLSNLRHPSISQTIGSILASAELRIWGLPVHAAGGSLEGVASSHPVWYTPTPTPTAKAEAAVGIGRELAHYFLPSLTLTLLPFGRLR
jgi:hypothetical protein